MAEDMMVDMKREEKPKLESVSMDQEYPYGLCVTIEEEQIAKLGMDKLPEVGGYVYFKAKAVVKHVSSSEHEGGLRRCVGLQITEMKLKDKEEKKSAASILYKE